MKRVIVLGNGKSRLGIELPSDIRTYGCNAAYRDTKITDLVAIDPAIQHEIYSSGYAKKNRCWFASWSPIHDVKEVEQFSAYLDPSNIIQNKPTNKCNIGGRYEKVYITWVDEEDLVNIIPPAKQSAWHVAIELAIKHGAEEIYLLGFDGKNNIYKGTENYHNKDGPYEEWYSSQNKILRENRYVRFYRIGCKLPKAGYLNCKDIDIDVLDLKLRN